MGRRITLTLHEAVAEALRTAAAARTETAGVLIVGVSQTKDEIRLLGREYVPAPEKSYLDRSPSFLRLASSAYMPAVARAGDLRAAALFVHSHPDAPALPSDLDDQVDEDLRPVFQIRTGQPVYGSLVIHLEDGCLSFAGRAWRGDERLERIDLVREVGRRIRFSPAVDASAGPPPPAVFDRQVRAFGPEIQRLLSTLHVGVVGCGGTGSPVAEQLTRLGVGRITLVDFDRITATNVTRVYGSTTADVGRPKAKVLRGHLRKIGLGTRIDAIRGTVTERAVAERLLECDVVFCCTDDHSGRQVLARLAYWFLIPVIDLGAVIEADPGKATIRDIVARINVEMPGTACGICCGFINPARIAAEGLDPDERRAREREGYVPDLDIPDPAVITYTTLAAALGLHALIVRIVGIEAPDAHATMFMASDLALHSSARSPRPGHFCGDRTLWGTGAAKRFLDQSWA